MPLFQLLLQLFAVLGPILSTPFAAKVMACIAANLTNPAQILTCIAGVQASTPAETAAHAALTGHLKAHIAANP